MRIECIEAGPNGEERPSGTLLMPGNQAGHVLKALVGATQEVEKRLREQRQWPAGNAQPQPARVENFDAGDVRKRFAALGALPGRFA